MSRPRTRPEHGEAWHGTPAIEGMPDEQRRHPRSQLPAVPSGAALKGGRFRAGRTLQLASERARCHASREHVLDGSLTGAQNPPTCPKLGGFVVLSGFGAFPVSRAHTDGGGVPEYPVIKRACRGRLAADPPSWNRTVTSVLPASALPTRRSSTQEPPASHRRNCSLCSTPLDSPSARDGADGLVVPYGAVMHWMPADGTR